MIRDREQAKDLTQETFLRAIQNYDRYEIENERGWLLTIARNLTYDYVKKKKPFLIDMDFFKTYQAPERSIEQTVILSESEKELYVALGKLKVPYRDVIILRKVNELSVKETAEILNWSESKVKVTLNRGLKALKNQLLKEGYNYEAL